MFAQKDAVLLILVVFLIVIGRSIRCGTGSSWKGMQAVPSVGGRDLSSPGAVGKKEEQAGQRPIGLGVHAGFCKPGGSLISLCVEYTDTPLDRPSIRIERCERFLCPHSGESR